MGLNVRIYNINSNGNYTIRYKSGNNPYPVETDSTFTLLGSYATSVTEVTISGLTFDTQYWIKMTDTTTGRYNVQNIYVHDSKAFPCYDTICFSVDVICESGPECDITYNILIEPTELTPTNTPTNTQTPTVTPTNTQTVTPTNTQTVTPTNTQTVTPTNTETPTVTPTPTKTSTPSLTSDCFKSWNINECAVTCSDGICACEGSTPVTVYTNCSVTTITGLSTEIYENTALTNPYTADFVSSGSIYNSSGSGVTLVCNIGGPC
jgi:hypothetical protein